MSADDRAGMSIMLTCKDCPKSVAYYRDVLGFELNESWPSPEEPQWANMVLGSQSVMLGAAIDESKLELMTGGDKEAMAYWGKEAQAWKNNTPGIGMMVYLQVPDVDAYAAEIKGRGASLHGEPKSQFYGIREQRISDPDDYKIVAFSPITMSTCQSCSMPLSEAEPGQMYCTHCTDETGALRSYEQILEGTTVGYFMGMKQMPRAEAEVAAKDHLSTMPAWSSRCTT
ncbi:MAG: putative glyoxalase superfamily protein PhnB [Planctomycetota bacterium]|jgi:uncharacterized glyoxalase superfamily protein PhnB